MGIHPKKIIIPVPFHSKAFVLLYKFETSWALLSSLSRSCFLPSQGPLTFAFHEPVPRRVSYFVSSLLKNCFSCFIQDSWAYPSFLTFKTFISLRSFYHPTFGFFQFLAVSTTDKPVNRSKHAYALG